MSIWRKHDMEARVGKILADVRGGAAGGRHFLSAYQIAMEFDRRHPGEAKRMGMEIGGEGLGHYHSLARYLANQIARNKLTLGVEVRFLDGRFLESLRYENDGQVVTSSLGRKKMSIFRLV